MPSTPLLFAICTPPSQCSTSTPQPKPSTRWQDLPILHSHYRNGDTARLSMGQFPLGLIPGGPYASQRVRYSPGGMFLLLTDGITEVVNERDEEFGLARLEQLLCKHAAQPLSQIWELVMGEVKQHGAQQDDQSLLLLRVRQ